MASDRFRVTEINYGTYEGTAMQLTAELGDPTEEPIHFDIMRACTICPAFDGDGVMYSGPTPSTKLRLPEVGMELVGTIAREGNNQIVRDSSGFMFLRNWAYADQYDETVLALARTDYMPGNYVPSGEIYRRAYAHTGNHELAREAAELYPGDYI